MDLDSVTECARELALQLTTEGKTPKAITYRSFTPTVPDAETQATGYAYESFEFTALKQDYTLREVQQSGGKLQLGDTRWIFAGEKVETVTTDDFIIEGDDIDNDPKWSILSSQIDIAKARWIVSARKV